MCKIAICLFSIKCQWALSALGSADGISWSIIFLFCPRKISKQLRLFCTNTLVGSDGQRLVKMGEKVNAEFSVETINVVQLVISSLRDNKWSRKLTIPAVTVLWLLVFWDTFYWLTLLFGELLSLIMGRLNAGVCVDFLWVLDSILNSSMTL